MNRTLKTFLLWLLIAVLPLHAVAGSFAMSCAPVHQQPSQSLPSSGVSHHELADDTHAHHGDQHAGVDNDSHTAGHGSASKVEKQSHSSCTACSAFCVGAAAPPSSSIPVPLVDGSDAVVVLARAFAVGFIQDGPQRPPRHQSA